MISILSIMVFVDIERMNIFYREAVRDNVGFFLINVISSSY
jgi:hypothetical protein